MNYPGLRTLQEKYGADGFNICAFPCNQFGGQAPLSSEGERAFAIEKFGFDFDVFVSSPPSLLPFDKLLMVSFAVGMDKFLGQLFIKLCVRTLQDKIDVNGDSAHPLYKYMKRTLPKSVPLRRSPSVGEKGIIEWNYVKFLVDRNGIPVRRYSPRFDPLQFEGDVSVPTTTDSYETTSYE